MALLEVREARSGVSVLVWLMAAQQVFPAGLYSHLFRLCTVVLFLFHLSDLSDHGQCPFLCRLPEPVQAATQGPCLWLYYGSCQSSLLGL